MENFIFTSVGKRGPEQMQENVDQNNSEYGHFSRSVIFHFSQVNIELRNYFSSTQISVIKNRWKGKVKGGPK